MTWKQIRGQSAVRKRLNFNVTIMRDQEVISFPSDDLLDQVDDSELSKFAVICVVFFLKTCSMSY